MADSTAMDAEVHSPVEVHVDSDDKPTHDEHFVGATLQIHNPKETDKAPRVDSEESAFDRTRPGSAFGRQSVKSTTSRTSMKPGFAKPDTIANSFFCYKENVFDKAVELCEQLLNPDVDGKLQGAWLLTEIDHWNNEREKIVLLTENSIMLIKFHFILNKIEESKRILLHILDVIAIGDFSYPDYSVMPERKHGGIQVRWNKNYVPSFGQRWNPWCSDIPWLTLAHHPLIYNPKENETVTYNVDDFYESLVQATSKCFEKKRPQEKITIIKGLIEIEAYASVASLVFNQSGLGFFRDRNGVCY